MTTPNNSTSPSRSSTPNPRFTSQAHTAEDVLKEQTVGLVHLSDFKKRRVEALEQISRDATPSATGSEAGDTDRGSSIPKKRKKVVKKGGLSFGGDDDDHTDQTERNDAGKAAATTTTAEPSPTPANEASPKKRLRPNTALPFTPLAQTKSSLLRDAALKDSLRKQYTLLHAAVAATDFLLPFVFFDGKNSPGGTCRLKKGEQIWVFLERARKLGTVSRGKEWARIGVDDLMCVRGEIVVPHHYDFHYFLTNASLGYDNKRIFPYSANATAATPGHLLPSARSSAPGTPAEIPDHLLEGYEDDPALTKVVDRRWYERNKHIYPASVWEDFDPEKDYGSGARTDGEGNAFFFARR